MNIAAQLFGLGAMISLFCIYQQKSRGGILAAKFSADVFWVAHYACLGGTAGMIPNAVGILREAIFFFRRRKKWASLVVWPILFILLNWALGFRTFQSAFDILPIAASTCVTISLWIDHPRLTKIISLPVSVAFMVYDLHIGSYMGMVNESIAILSILLSLLKGKRKA